MRVPLRHTTLQEMIFFLGTTISVNRSGMKSLTPTSKAAPISEKLRRTHATEYSPNLIRPNSSIRRRGFRRTSTSFVCANAISPTTLLANRELKVNRCGCARLWLTLRVERVPKYLVPASLSPFINAPRQRGLTKGCVLPKHAAARVVEPASLKLEDCALRPQSYSSWYVARRNFPRPRLYQTVPAVEGGAATVRPVLGSRSQT